MKSDEVQNKTPFSWFLSGWTVPLNNSVDHTDEYKTVTYFAITAVDFFLSKRWMDLLNYFETPNDVCTLQNIVNWQKPKARWFTVSYKQ